MKKSLYKQLLEDLKRDEGLRLNLYLDSKGYPTIGYGTMIESIDLEEAEYLLDHRTKLVVKELEKRKPIVKELPDEVQVVLFNMAYNLGIAGLLGFKRMWKAIEKRDWEGMAKEMIDSKWYKEVGVRARRLVERILSLVR